MQQIRQKRQTHHQEIRRQFLDNHFRELRKRHFNFNKNLEHDNAPNTHNQSSIFHMLLEQSLKLNQLAVKLRQCSLLQQLHCLINHAIKDDNVYQKKYLITIISNIFQDQLKPHQKQDLFRLSIKIFESLNISFLDSSSQDKIRQFKRVIQLIQPETLIFYMATANSNSQFLDEQDQIIIEKNIYPAFVNVLFYSLEKPYAIASIEDFCQDARRFIRSIFDLAAEHYEPGNRLKALRLRQFFNSLAKGHFWHLKNNQEAIINSFQSISLQFLWLYDKQTEYFDELFDFFKRPYIFAITQQTFNKNVRKINSTQMKRLFSIWTTYIEKNLFIQQVEAILTNTYGHQELNGIYFVMKQISESTELKYSAMELVYSFCLAFFHDGQFKHIFQKFSINLVDMAVRALTNFQIPCLSQSKNRTYLSKLILMIHLLMQKQNIHDTNGQKAIINLFVSQGGMRLLEQIQSWLMEMDSSEDSIIQEIRTSIQWILSQELQTQTYL